MDNKELVAFFADSGSGGGGSGDVTAAAVLTALQAMSNAQAAAALTAIDAEKKKMIVTITKSGNDYAANATYSQITAALAAGKIVEAIYGNYVAFCAGNVGGAIQFILIESYNNYSLTDGFKIKFFDVESNDSVLVGDLNYPPITVDAALSSSSTNPVQNKVVDAALALKADASALNNKADKPTTVTDLSSTSITLANAADNTIYEYGELSDLTVTAITNPGQFIISWRSGSTPTTINFPTSMRFPTSTNAMDACEANTDYEVNCRNGKCAVTAWPVVSP